jgi:hypothetical protein
MTLKEIENGTKFKLSKNGAVWIKLYEQGMNNQLVYCQSENKSNTRCQRMSFKHKYLSVDTNIIVV